jgi:hypothetical protein
MSLGATKKHPRQKLAPDTMRGLACVYLMSIISRIVMHLRTLPLLMAALIPCVQAEPQTLTDKQGRSLKAEVISVSGDQVKIKRDDGQTFNLPLASLSEDDQKKLKTWAEKEASKALPSGALTVELSRAKFETTKKDVDVTLSTGGIAKNGLTITNEKWGYTVTVANHTSQPLEHLRAEYRLFATVDDIQVKEKQGLKKKSYQRQIETIAELSHISFRTDTISAIKSKFNGNIVATKSGDSSSRETLHGIWLRIYRGDELVYEDAMPKSLSTTESW